MKKIERWLTTVEDYLMTNQAQIKNIRFFRQSVYALLFLKIVLVWPATEIFYQNILENTNINWNNPINWISKFLLLPALASHHQLIFIAFLAVIGGGILFSNRLIAILIFIISLNYGNLLFMASNGGDFILGFFAFMLVFINEKPVQSAPVRLINNSGWLLLKLNICAVYFINGYGKIVNKMWLNGSAMLQTWNLDYYANPNFVPNWFSNPLIAMVTGWIVIIFEFAFAFLIWYRRPRKALIIIGLIFHTFIAIFLSLPDFGITMMIAYLLFADFKKSPMIVAKKADHIHEPLT